MGRKAWIIEKRKGKQDFPASPRRIIQCYLLPAIPCQVSSPGYPDSVSPKRLIHRRISGGLNLEYHARIYRFFIAKHGIGQSFFTDVADQSWKTIWIFQYGRQSIFFKYGRCTSGPLEAGRNILDGVLFWQPRHVVPHSVYNSEVLIMEGESYRKKCG